MELFRVDIAEDDPLLPTEISALMRQLRPDLTAEAFLGFARQAMREGLRFTAARTAAGECLGVATHRLLTTSRGRILFVDDLVTRQQDRSAGVGRYLLDELAAEARRAGCDRIELDSGVTNHHAHRFYHARRMRISAFHFALDVAGEDELFRSLTRRNGPAPEGSAFGAGAAPGRTPEPTTNGQV